MDKFPGRLRPGSSDHGHLRAEFQIASPFHFFAMGFDNARVDRRIGCLSRSFTRFGTHQRVSIH